MHTLETPWLVLLLHGYMYIPQNPVHATMLTWTCQQELLVDELVAGADAVAREAISELCRTLLGTPPALATFGTLQALGPLRILLAPFPTPFEVLYRYCYASSPPALQLTS